MIRRFNILESQLASKNLVIEKQLSALESKDVKLVNKNLLLDNEVNTLKSNDDRLERGLDAVWGSQFYLMNSNKNIAVAVAIAITAILVIIIILCYLYCQQDSQRAFDSRRAIFAHRAIRSKNFKDN